MRKIKMKSTKYRVDNLICFWRNSQNQSQPNQLSEQVDTNLQTYIAAVRGGENVIRGYDHPSAESLVLALLVEPLQRRLVRDAVGLDLGAPHNLVVPRNISAQPANIIYFCIFRL